MRGYQGRLIYSSLHSSLQLQSYKNYKNYSICSLRSFSMKSRGKARMEKEIRDIEKQKMEALKQKINQYDAEMHEDLREKVQMFDEIQVLKTTNRSQKRMIDEQKHKIYELRSHIKIRNETD